MQQYRIKGGVRHNSSKMDLNFYLPAVMEMDILMHDRISEQHGIAVRVLVTSVLPSDQVSKSGSLP